MGRIVPPSPRYFLTPFYDRNPCWIFFPPGPRQLFSPLFLAFASSPPLSLPFLLSFCFSPSSSFIIYHFFLLSPFSLFLLFHIGSLSALPVLLGLFSFHPASPWFSTERLHLPPQFQCYWIVHCSHLRPLLVFPVSFSPHYLFLGLPALQVVILPWSSTGLLLLPPSCCFVFIFLLITIYCTEIYFVLWCNLPVSFLSHFAPLLYSTIVSRCLLALHMVFSPWNRTGLQLSPSCCFVW